MGTNIAILTGRLTADPEGRWYDGNNGQRLMATFRLAVNRNYKNAQGEREADFINCSISGTKAERLCDWARKGSLVTVQGSIKTRSYEDNDGRRVYVTEIAADDIEYLEARTQDGGAGNGYQGQGRQGGYQQQGNYQQPQGGGYQRQQQQQQPRNRQGNGYQGQGRQGGYQQQGSFFQGQTTNPMEISDDDLPF